jgi:ADP-ribose pyrophosphatase YjhB (NUDIX family)
VKPFRFCPACGTGIAEPHPEKGSTCSSCGRTWYRNSVPTVGAVIVSDGKALVARRAADPHKGRFDSPGGFLEVGEEALDGLRREIREELGVEIDVESSDYINATVHTYGDEDDYVLALSFAARIVSGEPKPDDDVAEVRWVGPDELDEIEWAWEHNREDTRRALQVARRDKKQLHDQVRMMGLVRVVAGASLIVLPRLSIRFWMGADETESASLRTAVRALGARDLAIGVGQLTALDTGAPVRPWVEAAVLSDAGDAVNSMFFMKDSPWLLRLIWTVVPGAFAWLGARHAADLD